MKLFECQGCGNAVHFDGGVCVDCGRRLGWMPRDGIVTALDVSGDGFVALSDGRRVFLCDNAGPAGCTGLTTVGEGPGLCAVCRHNRTVPDPTVAGSRAAWRRLEAAKRHLFYSIYAFGLPCPTRAEDPVHGLAFDFLADGIQPGGDVGAAMTGHASGIISVALAEADDAERERRRSDLGEPYRTLLGHFRHEAGHYFWDRLVADAGRHDAFRAVFGDERADYDDALRRHYAEGPAVGWQSAYVSAYAAVHPWEDFAETFAHVLHMVDGLETALAFGIRVRPRAGRTAAPEAPVPFDPYRSAAVEDLVEAWIPFTVAINAVNRSVGQPDLYPFVLSDPAIGKLGFVLGLLREAGTARAVPGGSVSASSA
jgi:hypothetical protein